MTAEPGMVTTQVLTISLAVFQRTALGRSEAPIPIMEELTTWVVETGAPTIEAAEDHGPRGQLCVHCVQGTDLVDAESDGPHDAPAAGDRSERDHRGAREDHPELDLKLLDEAP